MLHTLSVFKTRQTGIGERSGFSIVLSARRLLIYVSNFVSILSFYLIYDMIEKNYRIQQIQIRLTSLIL